MSFSELLEAVRRLPQAEKIQLMHELVDDVAQSREEQLAASLGITAGKVFDVWFPDSNGPAVAAALQALLEESRAF